MDAIGTTMKRTIITGLCALFLAACSNFSTARKACDVGGAATGMVLLGGGAMAGIFANDCGPSCVQWKIAHGESVHESTLHHVNRRDDLITYVGLPAAFVGAVGGAIIADHFYCSEL